MTYQARNNIPRASLGRIVLYVHDVESVSDFYECHFNFTASREEGDRIVELLSNNEDGFSILLHPLGKKRKAGQTLAKLIFDCEDVEAFCAASAERGLEFGALHSGAGYKFANTKDPAGNSVSISSRIYRHNLCR
ncbi:VOC family protein [Flexibacterium corallicola]|uniref:VOC family protein n=1 Tax=Flexibacterium corallicola TaxID=3037259 RepID=UPI00286F600B|nr:VOC family protein [Pseudovibrio sp. M1P-2-3]